MTHSKNKTTRLAEPQAGADLDSAVNQALKLFCADYFSDKFHIASPSDPRQLKTLYSTLDGASDKAETENTDTPIPRP